MSDFSSFLHEAFLRLKKTASFARPSAYTWSFLLRVKNRRELNASLKGTTLGEVEGDVDDTLKWIKRNKKKEKELAKKRQQELENMDKVFQEEYTERMYPCVGWVSTS